MACRDSYHVADALNYNDAIARQLQFRNWRKDRSVVLEWRRWRAIMSFTTSPTPSIGIVSSEHPDNFLPLALRTLVLGSALPPGLRPPHQSEPSGTELSLRTSAPRYATTWNAQIAKCVGFDGGSSEYRIGFPFFRPVLQYFTFALSKWTERFESSLHDDGVGC